ncbi:MAG: DUF1579 domain-containing protein [Planctomycetia bacterium]|nr:DUF1579 domain-containing protein [Planctomycetia bacterium]
MLKLKWLAFVVAAWFVAPAVLAQAPPEPGPEHKKLKELEGTWDAVIKMGGEEQKGAVTYKMQLGGLWLVGDFEADFGGMKFSGKGLDSFDPAKKKYISIWVDSMGSSPLIIEGTYDKEGKVLTMAGEGPGPDGKPTKYKTTTENKDKDTIFWTMVTAGADGKEGEMMSITYKRRK